MNGGEKELRSDIGKLLKDYATEAAYKVVSFLFEDVYHIHISKVWLL